MIAILVDIRSYGNKFGMPRKAASGTRIPERTLE